MLHMIDVLLQFFVCFAPFPCKAAHSAKKSFTLEFFRSFDISKGSVCYLSSQTHEQFLWEL